MMLAEDQGINALELVGAAREKKGKIEGVKIGIAGAVKMLRSLNISDDLILEKIMAEYELSEEETKEYLK